MPPLISSNEPQPSWDVAKLFPFQGGWSESQYLSLTESTNQLVELKQGRVEVLPMPTMAHQLIVTFLYDAIRAFAGPKNLGIAVIAPLRVRLAPGEFREPDVVFMLQEHRSRANNEFWNGADLIIEVVSRDPGSQNRDVVEKRADYESAGVLEYWIVDPFEKRITVLALENSTYAVRGEFVPGEQADSQLLTGFAVDVAEVFKAAEV
jgi:Uma2 family endonuclease